MTRVRYEKDTFDKDALASPVKPERPKRTISR